MTLSRYDQHTQIHNLICVYEGKEGGCSRVAVVVVQLLSHVQLFCNHMDIAARLLYPWESPGKNTGGGCHFLLHKEYVKIVLSNVKSKSITSK